MRILSEETRMKMREAWKRRRLTPVSAETRLKISMNNGARNKSDEWLRKIGEGNKGKRLGMKSPHTEEAKQRMSAAKLASGYRHSEETKEKLRIAALGEKSSLFKDGRSGDPAYNRMRKQTRRALGEVSPAHWAAIKAKFHYTCPACSRCEPDIKLTLDHIIPVCRGGTNADDNFQPLCGPCNSRKGHTIKRYEPISNA